MLNIMFVTLRMQTAKSEIEPLLNKKYKKFKAPTEN